MFSRKFIVQWILDNRWNLLIGVLLIVGVLIRIHEYLGNRSLDTDEAAIAMYLLNGSYRELVTQAPFFLLFEKVMISMFGHSEYSLRFYSFLTGILGLLLFLPVARTYLNKSQSALALGLLVMLDPIVKYTSQVKQYSGELLSTLVLLYIFSRIKEEVKWDRWYWLLLLAGIITPLFGYSAIFVIGSLGLILMWRYLMNHRQKQFPWVKITSELRPIAFMGCVWILALGLYYVLWMKQFDQNNYLDTFWEFAYLNPLHPKQFRDALIGVFPDQLSIEPIIGMFLFGVGLMSLVQRKFEQVMIFTLPFVLVIIASVLQIYPFGSRLLYFSLPLVIIVLAYSLGRIAQLTKRWHLVYWFFVIVLVFAPAVGEISRTIVRPRSREESRLVIAYMRGLIQPTDSVYVYYGAEHAYRYYTYDPTNQISSSKVIFGIRSRDDTSQYLPQVHEALNADRAWFVYSHGYQQEERYITDYIRQQGAIIIDAYHSPGASVYLVLPSVP